MFTTNTDAYLYIVTLLPTGAGDRFDYFWSNVAKTSDFLLSDTNFFVWINRIFDWRARTVSNGGIAFLCLLKRK